MSEVIFSIVCEAASHPPEVVKQFLVGTPIGVVPAGKHGLGKMLIDNQVVSGTLKDALSQEIHSGTPARRRYSYRCDQCGDNVTARHENLVACIERLVAVGVSHVSLTGLRGIL